MMKVVKREVEIVEVEGLASLLGERVLLMCANYFYEGILTGVNNTCVLLEDVGIVYETGPWSETGFKDRQQLPHPRYVQNTFIESYGLSE